MTPAEQIVLLAKTVISANNADPAVTPQIRMAKVFPNESPRSGVFLTVANTKICNHPCNMDDCVHGNRHAPRFTKGIPPQTISIDCMQRANPWAGKKVSDSHGNRHYQLITACVMPIGSFSNKEAQLGHISCTGLISAGISSANLFGTATTRHRPKPLANSR